MLKEVTLREIERIFEVSDRMGIHRENPVIELAAALAPERFLRQIEGELLRRRLDRGPRPSIEEAIRVTMPVTSALDFAHPTFPAARGAATWHWP
jgi:hypothetical protein